MVSLDQRLPRSNRTVLERSRMGIKVNREENARGQQREMLPGGLAEYAVIQMAAMRLVGVRFDVDARLPGFGQTRRIRDDGHARQQNVQDAEGAQHQAADCQ